MQDNQKETTENSISININAIAPSTSSLPVDNDDDNLTTTSSQSLKRTYSKPAQEKLANKIRALESKLNSQYLLRDSNLGSVSKKEIAKTKKDLDDMKQLLKTKQLNAEQKFRTSKKQKIATFCSTNKAAASILYVRETVGRPRIEEDQPELLKAIADVAIFGGVTHDRRRIEEIRSCKTLDDLHAKLIEMGFQLSRNATYLRLLPRSSVTQGGKRYVTTASVRLYSAQSDSHKDHPDGRFCTASIRYLESLASMLAPKQVYFISQDDKARTPIGLKAAQKQSPILMHFEYKVTLLDDWVIAERHKLIPSIYAGIIIKPQGLGYPEAVTYSGNTYVAIRSGKHDSSTAASHSAEFKPLIKIDDYIKPVIIISANGGPDENPRQVNKFFNFYVN